MTQEVLGLQSHAIALRLVQSVTQLQLNGMPIPSGPQVGNQVSVLGQQFIPSWAGINGPRGFNGGSIEPRLYEEGAGSLTFPNSAGEDGVRHLRRLLITVAGRMTPKGGNVTLYQGGAFRPGDEFIEIYRTNAPGAPGKPLFVLAVTKATVTGGSITLEGYDALWLLKKTRESAAGFFVNAPRDVIEHLSKVKQVVVADDFPPDGRFNPGTSTSTPDGAWNIQGASNVPATTWAPSTWAPSLGSVVRLQTYGSANLAWIASNGTAPAGFLQGVDPWVRWEAHFRFAPGNSPTANMVFALAGWPSGTAAGFPGPAMTLWPSASGTGNVNPPGYVQMQTAYSGGSGINAPFSTPGLTAQIPNFKPTVWHTAAIEARDRYVFFYIDGRLLGVLPQQGAVDNYWYANQSVGTWYVYRGAAGFIQLGDSSNTSAAALDVDYAVLRTKAPGLLRPASPANLGDYPIGGKPTPGAALLEVWHFDDGPFYGLEFSPGRLSQFSGKFATPALNFGGTIAANVPDWWPSAQGVGAWYNAAWACRATGSMHLDLGTYDYRFRFNADDGGRVWVGKTRFGEQLADNWRSAVQTGHASQIFITPYLAATSIGSTTLGAAAAAGATSITLASQPANTGAGMLIRIGAAAPYEWAYIATFPNNTITLRDALVRAHSAGDPVVFLNQGSLAGMPTGWYPFMFEFFNTAGGGVATLQYERSDHPGWWNGIGTGAYLHTVAALVSQYGGGTVPNHYWPLNEGYSQQGALGFFDPAGGTIAAITASDGNFIGSTRNTLVPGDQAPVFNAGITAGRAGDYLNAGNIPVSTAQWTMSALFRADTLPGSQMDVFRKEACLTMVITNSHQIQCYGYNTAWIAPAASAAVAAGQWYHVVGTWDGSTIRVYVNGQFVNSIAFAGQVNNANNLIIGSFAGSTEMFNGAIAHVQVLSKAMSAADVAALYAAMTSQPYVPVSESGIVDSTQQPYRYASHYDQLLQTVKDWGYQTTTEPMQLESGEFPGRVRPLLRVGRDTEYVVGSPQVRKPTASDIQDAITAEEVCDALVADAQGLADPTGASQISAEVFNFAEMFGVPVGTAAQALHPWLSEEYDQSNDISFPDQLVQRLLSQLALRGAPWEQVSMAHRPERQLVDTFPLSGAPAEFSWGPGDGVRLDMPELGIEDASPRQILGVRWPITPGGLGAPAISLRQRPRNFAQVMRDILRSQLTSQRAYQGQLVSATSPMGSNNGSGASVGSSSDIYARSPVGNNLGNVVAVTLNVGYKSDATQYSVYVNGNDTGLRFTKTGRYDLTSYYQRDTAGPQRFYVSCLVTSGATGQGNVEYQVETLYRI